MDVVDTKELTEREKKLVEMVMNLITVQNIQVMALDKIFQLLGWIQKSEESVDWPTFQENMLKSLEEDFGVKLSKKDTDTVVKETKEHEAK